MYVAVWIFHAPDFFDLSFRGLCWNIAVELHHFFICAQLSYLLTLGLRLIPYAHAPVRMLQLMDQIWQIILERVIAGAR